MSTLEGPLAELPLRRAMEAGDLDAAVAAFAPDAVLRSPLTGGLAFTGHAQIRAITEVVMEVLRDLRYTSEVRDGDEAFLLAAGRVGGEEIELVEHLRLDEEGRIRELTVFARPLPAAAIALRLLGTGLGRRRSRGRAALISALAAPVVPLTRAGDAIGVRLLRPTL